MLKAIAVFAAMAVLDFVWARYTRALQDSRAPAASAYAGAIILFGGAAQISYTADPWLLPAAILGAAAGTFAAVRFCKPGKPA